MLFKKGPDLLGKNAPRNTATSKGDGFNESYYRRYYGNRQTRVQDAASLEKLAGFIFAYLRYADIAVKQVLDLGCGIGLWKPVLNCIHPNATYLGVESSEYLREKYGWLPGSVVDYFDGRKFDLVICQGVLQYLSHKNAEKAIDNLALLCRGALYLEALTREDWETNCDRNLTDGNVKLRSAKWYRTRLSKHFINCGGGLFVNRETAPTFFELEIL